MNAMRGAWQVAFDRQPKAERLGVVLTISPGVAVEEVPNRENPKSGFSQFCVFKSF